jgi:hypothetical protein
MSFKNSCNNSFIRAIFVMYYAPMLRCWQLVMILVKTNHPCLWAGCHNWYQSITGIIYRLWPYFWKPTVRKRLDAHRRIIVVLTCDKLTEIYFMHLLYSIYYSPIGWCESWTHPLKTRLAWGQSLSCGMGCVSIMQLATTTHLVCRDLGMSCGCLQQDVNTFS